MDRNKGVNESLLSFFNNLQLTLTKKVRRLDHRTTISQGKPWNFSVYFTKTNTTLSPLNLTVDPNYEVMKSVKLNANLTLLSN